jgi:hypothetical protein
MNKTVLLAASAVLALTAGSALAGSVPGSAVKAVPQGNMKVPAGILYSQNSNYGADSIVSQNFSSTFSATYDAAGADDFVVPKGKTWTVKGGDFPGVYFNGSGPASSETITFYKGKLSPGKVMNSQTVTCTDSAGSFSCNLKSVKLKGGKKGTTYWVSIAANLAFSAGGEWGWTTTVDHNQPGKWQNPGGGFGVGCTTWTNLSQCIASAGTDDFAFDISGKG